MKGALNENIVGKALSNLLHLIILIWGFDVVYLQLQM